MSRSMFVYIITNRNNSVLYTGVTNDLLRRVHEHRHGTRPSFAKRYALRKLVYFEQHGSPESAIGREKQIKSGSRRAKERLIEAINPGWQDLTDRLLEQG